MQHHVWDLTLPPSRPVRADDEMSVQEQETTHVPFTHSLASDSNPPDIPVGSAELEDSAQTMSTRRVTFKRPPNPVDRAGPPKRIRGDHDEDSPLLSAFHHSSGEGVCKFERWQRCLQRNKDA